MADLIFHDCIENALKSTSPHTREKNFFFPLKSNQSMFNNWLHTKPLAAPHLRGAGSLNFLDAKAVNHRFQDMMWPQTLLLPWLEKHSAQSLWTSPPPPPLPLIVPVLSAPPVLNRGPQPCLFYSLLYTHRHTHNQRVLLPLIIR